MPKGRKEVYSPKGDGGDVILGNLVDHSPSGSDSHTLPGGITIAGDTSAKRNHWKAVLE